MFAEPFAYEAELEEVYRRLIRESGIELLEHRVAAWFRRPEAEGDSASTPV